MDNYKFRNENMRSIKSGFLDKIHKEAGCRTGVANSRSLRKPAVIAIAAAAIIISTAICAIAAGFDPMSAWRGLLGQEMAVDVNRQVISYGISMKVRGLYTDGNKAILEIVLQDLDGQRFSVDNRIRLTPIGSGPYHIADSFYDAETGEVTLIALVYDVGSMSAGDLYAFTINSIFVNLGYSDEYSPFDLDLFEAAANSKLRPTISADEWVASARENPASVDYDPENARIPGGTLETAGTNGAASQRWLPLDAFAEGEYLTHWLSVLGVGFDDGMLHVQMRYNGLFGSRCHYIYGEPVLIDNEGNITTSVIGKSGGEAVFDELLCCGYQEQRFDVGSIDNLKNLKLAWKGNFAEHVIDGDWTVDIDLSAIGGSISASSETSAHPDVTGASFRLSPMYFEAAVNTAIDFPDFSSIPSMELTQNDSVLFWRQKMNEVASTGELAIILSDGTKIGLAAGSAFDTDTMHGLAEGRDSFTGMSTITTWHILDGSFGMDEVAEVIVFGESFDLYNVRDADGGGDVKACSQSR